MVLYYSKVYGQILDDTNNYISKNKNMNKYEKSRYMFTRNHYEMFFLSFSVI